MRNFQLSGTEKKEESFSELKIYQTISNNNSHYLFFTCQLKNSSKIKL